ncbi:GIN domain-containing protein [Pedobacter metabolipauper]|nr:DUF2807 domain-containing protein [Pedobacter metabolipauper]
MKTLTKTFFSLVLIAGVMVSATVPALAVDNNKDATSAITAGLPFNKILVSGNVKVVLVQSTTPGVEVDTHFNPEKTRIQKKGLILMISSTEVDQVMVTVSVNDLQRIDASENSAVVTSGRFNVKYLQIFLKDYATANVNAVTGSLYTIIKGNASLKLSGAADQHTLIAKESANADLGRFKCKNMERFTSESLAAMHLPKSIMDQKK